MSSYVEEARWGPWVAPAALLPMTYLDLVVAAGGRPLLVPHSASGTLEGADEVIEAVDALVLTGGGDVDPSSYGHRPHDLTGGVDARRDAWERALVGRAIEAGLPVLAICRGLQVLNVHLGGTLSQHLPDLVEHEGHRPAPGRFGSTAITTAPGSLAEAVFGRHLIAACSHHQALDRLGEGLTASAWSLDGSAKVVEAAEMAGRTFVLGLQWHPEEQGDARAFAALVAACRRGR